MQKFTGSVYVVHIVRKIKRSGIDFEVFMVQFSSLSVSGWQKPDNVVAS
jgi:hypothetical protein